MSNSEKIILGARTLVDLPDCQLFGLEAKVDTGAQYSAIHCLNPKVVGQNLTFTLLDPQHSGYNGRMITVKDFDTVRIKSSNGQVGERYLMHLSILVKGRLLNNTFTLVDRSRMSVPVLLGRDLLANGFMVDVTWGLQ